MCVVCACMHMYVLVGMHACVSVCVCIVCVHVSIGVFCGSVHICGVSFKETLSAS